MFKKKVTVYNFKTKTNSKNKLSKLLISFKVKRIFFKQRVVKYHVIYRTMLQLHQKNKVIFMCGLLNFNH